MVTLPLDIVAYIFFLIPDTYENIHHLARGTCAGLRRRFSYIPRPPRLIEIAPSDRPINLHVDILEDERTVTWRRMLHYYPICECCGERETKTPGAWPIEAYVGRYHFNALCGKCETILRKEVRKYHPIVTSFKHIRRDTEWWCEYSERCKKYILWEKE